MENTKPCPFCAEPIQAAAVKCRFCNSMLTTPSAPGAVTTVEQTAKKWKGLRLAAVVMILVSFIGVLAVGSAIKQAALGGASSAPALVSLSPLFALTLLGGIGLYVYARVAAWWHHG